MVVRRRCGTLPISANPKRMLQRPRAKQAGVPDIKPPGGRVVHMLADLVTSIYFVPPKYSQQRHGVFSYVKFVFP